MLQVHFCHYLETFQVNSGTNMLIDVSGTFQAKIKYLEAPLDLPQILVIDVPL
jgi:hypothetical protein